MNSPISIKNKIQDDKVLKASSFKKEVRVTTPHKHNSYFEIIYLSKGSGFHYIDSQRYEVVPNSVFFVRKEQIHYWELASEPEGYVVIIKKRLIDQSIDKEIKSLLYQLSKTAVLHIKQTGSINKLFEILIDEGTIEDNSSNALIEGLLKALLAKILSEGEHPYTNNRIIEKGLYHNFRELLSQEKTLKNSVAYYAGKLNTSPQNLNLACKKEINSSASTVLSEFIINEAKRLLIYTDNTVAEIAFILSFNDPSHFIKYFKRFTTITPQNYRVNLF
ncbi:MULTISPECIES: AraC family transcriptional regulator [Pedobacter]|uniref:Helix-turn-helix domain-containing protein n=2 Tax=Pedobacter TaxID=84567 RepID=A0A3N0BXX8_9SPHI|nr:MULTISPECIES: helix-turn-helix domain-containing protein [Pedobacter]RNL54603.1 helix-turn-helix domain-containing protein [Pedobacter jejuensis]GGI23369.1 AraC family transcriptional regulator [Pedobacter mendelii]